MRILYDLFFLIFSLLYIPTLVFKGKAHKDLAERFGFLPEGISKLSKPVWIHGVSVGETGVAVRIASEIKKHFPGVQVVISTTTKTGNDLAKKSGSGIADGIFYFPLDMTAVVSRVVRKVCPRLFITVETELWPNLLEELRSRKVPVAVVNGRISDKSFSRYMLIKLLMKRILACVDVFCMQTASDADRIKKLGALESRVNITGNMKFDDKPLAGTASKLDKAYFGFTESCEILVAGSTHFSEENTIIDVYTRLLPRRPGLKLVIAPRHVERTEAIEAYVGKAGLRFAKFSELSAGKRAEGVDVVIVDTIGHLKDVYSVATLVFIGGSIVKKGGQNPIEAASWGKAVVFGPNMFNFREVSRMFLEREAAIQVKDGAELGMAVAELLNDPAKREAMGVNALRVIQENSGAVIRTADVIAKYVAN